MGASLLANPAVPDTINAFVVALAHFGCTLPVADLLCQARLVGTSMILNTASQ